MSLSLTANIGEAGKYRLFSIILANGGNILIIHFLYLVLMQLKNKLKVEILNVSVVLAQLHKDSYFPLATLIILKAIS